ncbi:MAG: HPr(Ser) kinase/phosphatase [Eubacteriales bacterium]|nr:HPr(Ser) kinase/phosphatase [Eubacteriales bacterium]
MKRKYAVKGAEAMIDTYSVPLKTLVDEFHLEIAYASTDYSSIRITVEDVSRPGLQLAGFFDHYEPMRLQVMGNVEMSYMGKLTPANRSAIFDRLFSYKFPALLIARGIQPHPEMLEMAKKHNITILLSKDATSAIVSSIIAYLKTALAPRVTRHGVLVEVYGEGILLTGDSGIGKSECAVELLKRGHRLIADDAVEIRKVSAGSLMGTAPALIRNYVELRGIGIINVAKLFGMGSVKLENEINLVMNIVPWNTQEAYDRLGLEEHYTEILGVKVPMNTIPITPGRNLAVILEVAAMNNRQKKMGYNAALEFTEQINRHFDENIGKI